MRCSAKAFVGVDPRAGILDFSASDYDVRSKSQ